MVSHTIFVVVVVFFFFRVVDPDVKSRVFSAVGDDKPKILCADIIMISGCEDKQTSADVGNVS